MLSDLPLLLGVASLYWPLSLSRDGASMVGNGGGEDICMARTEDGFRNGGRSLLGVYRESRLELVGGTGLEDSTEISEGREEIKLVEVTPDVRRDDCEMEGRDV